MSRSAGQRADAWWQMPALQWLLTAAGCVLAFRFNAALALNVDVSWFYYVAQRVLGGAVLYRDLIEPNAPFASLSMIPAVLLAEAASLSAFHAILLYVVALGFLCFAACTKLLACYGMPRGQALWFRLLLFAALFFLPGGLFGEREHLFCIMAMPYVMAVPLRCAGRGHLKALRFAAGLFAGVAVNLKPPFALIILAVELASLVIAGRRGLFAPDQFGLGVAALFSALFYPLLFPLYASSVLPWVVDLYGAFADTAATWRKTSLWGGALFTMFLVWGRAAALPLERLRWFMLSTAAASLVVFAVQDKGWDYQIFIAMFMTAVMAGMALQVSAGRPVRLACAGVMSAILVVRAGVQYEAPDYVKALFPTVERLIAESSGSFLVLTSAGSPGFPLTVETGHAWASRYACLVMLPGIVAAEVQGRHSRWEAPFRAAMDEDLERNKPPLVFVQNDELPGLPPHFDVLAWLRRDPRFASEWAHYRSDGTADIYFGVFRRI